MNEQPAASSSEQAYANTDRELWRKGDGDGDGMSYYEPSIHVTERGLIGINVGGNVFVLPVEEWHALAAEKHTLPAGPSAAKVREYTSDELQSPEYLLREEREWILELGRYEGAVREAVAYAKQIEGHSDDWPAWVEELDALADDLRDGTAETKEQLNADA